LHSELLKAIDEDQLFLEYQPQMSADGRTMVSVEALVRWNHPIRGRLGPDKFIGVAEELGIMPQLGAWVLRQACRDAMRWSGIAVAVNISALQLRHPGFEEDVTSIVGELDFPFERLELEIVESAFIEDIGVACRGLHRLRDLGVKIALDDFGTGYSSLTYLRRLPLDKIKIDKSFVQEIEMIQSAAIVHAVIALARALGLKTTAEGVETEAQQRFLRVTGCHLLQGYLFARPLPAEEISFRLTAPESISLASQAAARVGPG
jgi:EAL domain-containing protein (putative c-di-GMP-specific phosphodiesterase class I)